ncbi:MAG TPA: hypothetical protein DGG95_00230 [Cytophagales bacterium]|jgi:pyruvate, water dikinase|nr:hypothetical protein [Cytophagales bacterium]
MINEITLALDREIPDDFIISKVAGVGMLKSEKTTSPDYITIPSRMEENRKYLSTICSAFRMSPVWYRTDDTPTYRANKLRGTEIVIDEENPLLGLRGLRRSLTFVKTFRKELEMFLSVREKHPNLNLLLPVVHDVSQVAETQKLLDDYGYNGRIGIMLEIPAAVLCINEFIDLGVDYFMVGINDLTSFTLGISRRDNSVKNSINYQHNSISFLLDYLKKIHSPQIEIAIGGEIVNNLDFYKGFEFNSLAVPYKDIYKVLEVDLVDYELQT